MLGSECFAVTARAVVAAPASRPPPSPRFALARTEPSKKQETMQGRGQVGKTHDRNTIVKRKNRQKVWFSEVGEAGWLQKGPFWMTEAEAAAAEGLLLFRTREVVVKAPNRETPASRQETLLFSAFPLCNLPEELQLIVAAQVAAPHDRAALCIAVPPLGRKAIKEIKAYQVPLIAQLPRAERWRRERGRGAQVRAQVCAGGGHPPPLALSSSTRSLTRWRRLARGCTALCAVAGSNIVLSPARCCGAGSHSRTLAFERRDWCRISKWKKSSGRQAGKVVGDGGASLLQARQWRRSGAYLAAVLAASRARPERIASRLVGAAEGG